jgi:MFS family permease
MAFYMGYNVVYTVSCWLAGRLADRYPKHQVLATGYALGIVPALALLVPGNSYAKFAVAFGMTGLYMGFYETVESASAAALLPAEVRGAGFGVLTTFNGIGDVVSSVVVGTLWAISPRVAMGFVIAMTCVGSLVIASLREEELQESSP